MADDLDKRITKSEVVIFGAVIICAFFLALLFAFLSVKSKTPGLEQTRQQIKKQSGIENIKETQTSDNKLKTEEYAVANATKQILPIITFSDYQLSTSLPRLSNSVMVYDLKTQFNRQDAIDLGRKIGMNTDAALEKDNYITLFDKKNREANELLVLHKKSGAFTYLSSGLEGTETTSFDPIAATRSFIDKIGFLDDTIVVTATFEKKSAPEAIFVEAHRIPTLPIFNPFSTLNIAVTSRLDNIAIGKVNASSLADPDIINSSDGGDGRQRPNDHNTLTVAVSKHNGKIIAASSTLRQPIARSEKDSHQYLISFDEALNRAKLGQIVFSLAAPTGDGYVDIRKLTPEEFVVGDNATVTDATLAYIDETPDNGQTSYQPHYILRGTATLSGYHVNFVQVVLATKKTLAQNQVLGQQTNLYAQVINQSRGNSLQYGTIEFEPTEKKTAVDTGVTIPPPTLPPSFPPPSDTPPTQAEATFPPTGSCPTFTNCYQSPKNLACGSLCFYPSECLGRAIIKACGNRRYYYIPCANEAVDARSIETLSVWSNLRDLTAKFCMAAISGTCPITSNQANSVAAQRCYQVSTGSPALYLYFDKDEMSASVSVFPLGGPTYADPAFSDNIQNRWNVKVNAGGWLTLADATTRDHLYYELNTRNVLPQIRKSHDASTGFVVEKTGIEGFLTDTLFKQIGLNQNESQNLLKEVQRELYPINSKYVTLSLVEPSLLERYLPINITPLPTSLTRVVLYIEPVAEKKKLKMPSFPHVTRAGFAAVELGVFVDR